MTPSRGENTSLKPYRCETCRHWANPVMGRGFCDKLESHPATLFNDTCVKWEKRKGAPKKLDFIQDSDPGDEA